MTFPLDRFSADSIRAAGMLSEQYMIEVCPTLASTNQVVRLLAERGAPNGTVIFANEQTAGRGRLGRSFYSPPDSGIYLSLLLRPQFPSVAALSVTTFAAVAVARAIERVTSLRTSLKWVNDVWIGNRKVCGILAESALALVGDRLSYIVLGIGINVNQTMFPGELSPLATSLYLESGDRIDRSRLAAVLLSELEPLLAGAIPSGYMDEYRRRNLVLGRALTVLMGDRTYEAVGKSIDNDGSLIVTREDGREERICAGEVSIRLSE